MANTSATGGALLPLSGAVPADLDLDVILGRLVREITGLAPGMVRPRWQEKPPQAPPKTENWCAIGVMRTTAEGEDAFIAHDSAGDGQDVLVRYEILDVLASFYGPASAGLAGLFRDGLRIPQNREPLFLADMALVDASDITPAPAFVNTTWQRRQDITFRIRRRIERTYAVRNILSSGGTIHAESLDQDFNVEPR